MIASTSVATSSQTCSQLSSTTKLVADREHLDDALGHRTAPLGPAVAEPQRRGDQRLDVGGSPLAELDEQHAVVVAVGDRRGDVPGQPRLAHPARTAQGDHPAAPHGVDDAREVRGAADEGAERYPRARCAGAGGRFRTGGDRDAGDGQLLTQHPPLELPQLRGRVEAELVGEPRAEAGEGGERVALPAAGDQGLHEHADGPLPQRLGSHQRLELRHGLRGPTRRQQRLRVLLDRSGPQLGEPRDLGGQRVVVQLRVRLPRQSASAAPRRSRRATGSSRVAAAARWSANAVTSTFARSASSR